LDILFTVFKDIFQFVGAIYLAVDTRAVKVYTLVSLSGSGLSIIFSFATYFFRVKKSFSEPKEEEKKPIITPQVPVYR
jgi:hypothetical protein